MELTRNELNQLQSKVLHDLDRSSYTALLIPLAGEMMKSGFSDVGDIDWALFSAADKSTWPEIMRVFAELDVGGCEWRVQVAEAIEQALFDMYGEEITAVREAAAAAAAAANAVADPDTAGTGETWNTAMRVTSQGGAFYITGSDGTPQKIDIAGLIMMMNIDRVGNLDKQLEEMLNEMQERNSLIQKMTDFMSLCRTHKASGKGDGINDDGGMHVTINGETKRVAEWAAEFGFEWTFVDGALSGRSEGDQKTEWNNGWQANIDNIKSKIDNLNNDSQIDNIRLQSLLDKRNNAFEMTTKILDSHNESLQSIFRNL